MGSVGNSYRRRDEHDVKQRKERANEKRVKCMRAYDYTGIISASLKFGVF